MLTFKQQAAQGDLLIERVAKLPADAKLADKEGTNYVVAHSETGHHHTVAADKAEFYTTEHPMVCYLQVSESVDLIHHRSFDTHPTFTIPPGTFKLRRQREHTPSGWRRIED